MDPLQKRMRLRRKALGDLSQERLAQRTAVIAAEAGGKGLSRQSVINIENNGQVPKADNLALLARALECSADYLLGLTDDPMPYDSPERERPATPESAPVRAAARAATSAGTRASASARHRPSGSKPRKSRPEAERPLPS
jgi:transcriptional regulator with XRE-family HTH domain